jgi:hypothetical protein
MRSGRQFRCTVLTATNSKLQDSLVARSAVTNLLKGLLVVLISVVLVPGVIVIASLILGMANESAGWLRYKLPEVFFWIFLSTGIASPFLGIATLVFLWVLRRRWLLADGGKMAPKTKTALILAAVAAIIAPAAWTVLFSEVFFVAGGNR